MVSSVAGGADPGRGTERLTERLFSTRPAAKKRLRIRLSKDVACRPNVKTGATVPSYSGGGAAAWSSRIRISVSASSVAGGR